MKGYCGKCDEFVEALEGYYYWKCPVCYHPVRLSFINKVKTEIFGVKNA